MPRLKRQENADARVQAGYEESAIELSYLIS
jgi:hypothetical protein